ncbi:MAG: divergent PAP2 family protein [Caldilineaceae bacterium]|nr:divergent PAP2 family protein [Caldilineaceae bacterium]MCB0185368.1 divergent PAP2 family protein [Caldilineaceae bacterium]HRW04125.1 divergent PAP2 family protein [Caldilineaceae bacterium]
MTPLLSNSTLWIPVSIAFFVQLFKFLWEWTRTGRPDLRILSRSGGMPSSHTALVVSLATVLGIEYGLDSSFFAIGVVLAVIVMYDATGVRQQSGKHARVLNQILRELFSGQPISEEELKELLGHTSVEVLVGALLGIVYASSVMFLLQNA